MMTSTQFKSKFQNVVILIASSYLLIGCSSFPPRDLSQKGLSIAECPPSPNCVSSQSTSPSHKVDPIQFNGSFSDFQKMSQSMASKLPRTKVIRSEGSYVHMVSTSLIFRFKDDLELYYSEPDELIHIRSSSRVGYSDLGVNRKRVESIREILKISRAPKKNPIIIAHRGASGYRPEHTIEAYKLAIEMGADFIEPDLVVTKDGILIARHENELSDTTDVAIKFPDRKTTKVIDGKSINGWFSEDFTLAEIKTLRAKERLSIRNQSYNGQFEIPSFDEILTLAKTESQKRSKTIGIYPETKHPGYFESLQLPFEDKLLKSLEKAKLDNQTNPIFIQSFELPVLKKLMKQTNHPLVLLIGDKKQFPSDLVELKQTVSGIGFHKSHLKDQELLQRILSHNFLIHVYTFRSDKSYLDSRYKGKPELEYLEFFNLGVDGVFTDFPDDAIRAREMFLDVEVGK